MGIFGYRRRRMRRYFVSSVLFDGRNHGINEAADALNTKIDDPRLTKLATEVTVGQIIDGVDSSTSKQAAGSGGE